MSEYLAIGVVLGSHGVRGDLKVRSTSGEMEHFTHLKHVVLARGDQEGSRYSVQGVRGNPASILLSLEGIDDPETARTFKGCELRVPREHAAPLQPGEFYIADLVGCKLVFENQIVGEVTGVWNNSNTDMFDVTLADNEHRNVPFQKEFIGEVDVTRRTIELKHDWILE